MGKNYIYILFSNKYLFYKAKTRSLAISYAYYKHIQLLLSWPDIFSNASPQKCEINYLTATFFNDSHTKILCVPVAITV